MKSTENQYFPNLDHVRGFAAFFVFAWHFKPETISTQAHPGLFLFSLIDEGHCGVSLFIVLSGYLFTKLLVGRSIILSKFYFNRALRLAPLLVFVLIIYAILLLGNGQPLLPYLIQLPLGLVLPTWPGGAWSITTEIHFYLLLPLLLILLRRFPQGILALVGAAIFFRFVWWLTHGSVQTLAFYTIVGRIDQFLFGMFACHYAGKLKNQHFIAVAVLLLFAGFYYWFDLAGGYEHMPSIPSPSWIWIIMPTIEGSAFAMLIAYYDQTYVFRKSIMSSTFAFLGTVSYSIYLLHPFIIHSARKLITLTLFPITNFNEVLAGSIIGFSALVPIAWVSYRLIEYPTLAFRLHYLAPKCSVAAGVISDVIQRP